MEQRTIKFRCWERSENRMIEWDAIYKHIVRKGGAVWFYFGGDQEMIMQQFTGLTDKNGKEIYEGDIVAFMQGEQGADADAYKVVRPISFYCGAFMYDSVPLSEWSHTEGLVAGSLTNRRYRLGELFMIDFSLEVIGNVYEHPDLLKTP